MVFNKLFEDPHNGFFLRQCVMNGNRNFAQKYGERDLYKLFGNLILKVSHDFTKSICFYNEPCFESVLISRPLNWPLSK